MRDINDHTQTIHLIHLLHHTEIAIEIVAAFDIQDGRHLPLRSNTLDVIRIECELHLVTIFLELLQCVFDSPQRLLRLEAIWVVFLWNIDGHEKRTDASLFCTREIPVAVFFARANAAAKVELTIQSMHMTVKH